MTNRWRRTNLCLLLAAIALSAGGCQLLYFAGGQGSQSAAYKFKKTDKVLVLVEVAEGISAPPYLPSTLADSIGKHLWKYHAVEKPLASQDALVVLQTTHPEEFKKMGDADIAQAMGADMVLKVFVTNFVTPKTTDGGVGEGYAQAYVKVISKKGERLFPGNLEGLRIVARADEMLIGDRDMPKTVQTLINQLALLSGRLFHDYDSEDKELNPSNLDPNKQMHQ